MKIQSEANHEDLVGPAKKDLDFLLQAVCGRERVEVGHVMRSVFLASSLWLGCGK